MKSEQQEVYEFLVFVISHFGTDGQPEATVATLHLFTEKYVGGCIKRAIASGKLAQKYVKMGREYLVLTNKLAPHPTPNGKVAAQRGDPRCAGRRRGGFGASLEPGSAPTPGMLRVRALLKGRGPVGGGPARTAPSMIRTTHTAGLAGALLKPRPGNRCSPSLRRHRKSLGQAH
jgi:hypothetical protein